MRSISITNPLWLPLRIRNLLHQCLYWSVKAGPLCVSKQQYLYIQRTDLTRTNSSFSDSETKLFCHTKLCLGLEKKKKIKPGKEKTRRPIIIKNPSQKSQPLTLLQNLQLTLFLCHYPYLFLSSPCPLQFDMRVSHKNVALKYRSLIKNWGDRWIEAEASRGAC